MFTLPMTMIRLRTLFATLFFARVWRHVKELLAGALPHAGPPGDDDGLARTGLPPVPIRLVRIRDLLGQFKP
jgi:hypothetical protein